MTDPDAAVPRAQAEGPAFPIGVRLLATVMVAAMLHWGLRSAGPVLQADWTAPAALLVGASIVLVLWCLVWMWRSRTSVDENGIVQTWIWRKQVRWRDIAQARIIGIPGLEWLIAPRLVVRPRGGGLLVFHSADRQVLTAFAQFVALGMPPGQGS